MLRQSLNKLTFEDSTYKKILKNPFKSKIKLDCLCLCRGNMFHCKKIKGFFGITMIILVCLTNSKTNF